MKKEKKVFEHLGNPIAISQEEFAEASKSFLDQKRANLVIDAFRELCQYGNAASINETFAQLLLTFQVRNSSR